MKFSAILKTIAALTLFASASVFAETTTIDVEGMHCAGCKKMIEQSVCKSEEVTKNAESCEVKLTNPKKQIGQIKITTKKDAKLDVDAVKAKVTVAGEDYKVKNVETK